MRYIPFLKLKNNEISALKDLPANIRANLTPLLDIPRIKDMRAADFVSRIDIALKCLNSHWDKKKSFYIDVFDISPKLKPDGKNIYQYYLEKLCDFKLIPVIGLDRDQEHIRSVATYLRTSGHKKKIGIRLLPSDFISFDAVKDEIDDLLGEIIDLSDSVDLLLDARTLTKETVKGIASSAAEFANRFSAEYDSRRIVITGSSIPSSISEVVGTNEAKTFERLEKQLWSTFSSKCSLDKSLINFGDYGTVSPEYSDIDLSPEMFPNVATPKIIYTSDKTYFVVRGGAFKTHPLGYRQYYTLAKIVASQSFFRGPVFSSGDKYIHERSCGNGTSGSPGSWVKVVVNSHLSFVGHELS